MTAWGWNVGWYGGILNEKIKAGWSGAQVISFRGVIGGARSSHVRGNPCKRLSLPSFNNSDVYFQTSDGEITNFNRKQVAAFAPPEPYKSVGSCFGSILSGSSPCGIALASSGAVTTWEITPGIAAPLPPASASFGDIKALATGSECYIGLNSYGTVLAGAGSNAYNQLTIPPTVASGVKSIAGGLGHCLALKTNGTVIGWGQNFHQECTPPSTLTNAIAIAAGSYFSLALTSSGSVVGWGITNTGQINIPAACSSGVKAIAVGYNCCMALKDNGTIVGWGNEWVDPPAAASSKVIEISCQGSTNVALLSDGTVISWLTNQSN